MTLGSKLRSLLLAGAVLIPMLTLPVAQAHAGVFISVGFAPPVLPVYVQPPLPAPGYMWSPGYWAYGDAGYYWVPGVWVMPPAAGVLWTPGYWGFGGGLYMWHPGYWGPHVGFYGGVNYGFGYGGIGFFGGEWRGGVFAYNRAVANFGGVHVTNVYEDRTVIERNTIVNANHVSYNGGGGIAARPTAMEMQAAHENHMQPTANQVQHANFAAQDRSQLASVNHGRPGTMAASNVNSYHQTAVQHARTQPISAADRAAGNRSNANNREIAQQQRAAQGSRSGSAAGRTYASRQTGQQRTQANRNSRQTESVRQNARPARSAPQRERAR